MKEGGREGGRERGKEGVREGGREGREGRREGVKEGGREGEKIGRGERGQESIIQKLFVQICLFYMYDLVQRFSAPLA